jgi:PRTRC genetic system ThiF family protein
MKSQNRKSHIALQFQRILIIGAGGTGSYLAQGLAKMVAGYHLDIEVLIVDPDIVEEKNCARQNFHPWEIGQGKAEALTSRLNQQYGIAWAFVKGKGEDLLKGNPPFQTVPTSTWAAGKVVTGYDHNRLTITCVDTVAARKPCKGLGPWLDLGNGVETGQALYGTTEDLKLLSVEVNDWEKKPTVGNLPSPFLAFGMSKLKTPKKKAPSCADTPFAEQGVFANEWAAAAGLTILHQLLIKGDLTTPAIYFNISKGWMAPEFITRDYLSR